METKRCSCLRPERATINMNSTAVSLILGKWLANTAHITNGRHKHDDFITLSPATAVSDSDFFAVEFGSKTWMQF